MSKPVLFVFAALVCATLGGGLWLLLWDPIDTRPSGLPPMTPRASLDSTERPDLPPVALDAVINKDPIDDGGLGTADEYLGEFLDPGSLRELGERVRARGKVGLANVRDSLKPIRIGPGMKLDQARQAGEWLFKQGMLEMYEGQFPEATASFEKALEIGNATGLPARVRTELLAIMGVVALRRGEVENGLVRPVPSSGLFPPIAREAVHRNPDGSREAIRRFSKYLEEFPGDLRIRWLLNIAYMTLGEYPDKVPPGDLIPPDRFASKLDVGRLENVAPTVGLTSRGPNLAGGSILDDFNGDGRPDVLATSLDADRGASMFVNRGDGTFEDRSESAGLAEQVYAINARHADYDNDGDLDVLLLRGGGERPIRLSLLRNRGDATFEDATMAAGLGTPIASGSAAWGDYDDDGRVDLFVCGEYVPPSGAPADFRPDPRNRCRLYHNKGDGTFEDVAAKAGVTNERCARGAAWGDYDGDGRLDLFVSNADGPGRLYHNKGSGTFEDLAPSLDVTGAEAGAACWFWDFDNDGRLDLFVNEGQSSLAETVGHVVGARLESHARPRLYRNTGDGRFRDLTRESGLDRPLSALGCNFGDIDDDGFLDMYLGTGWISYTGLFPNILYKNVDGKRFEDVTTSSCTGHLQKGNGVAFADFDNDGDLDLFVETGGAVPGDRSYNLLFRNPGHGRHWLKVKLIGTRTNRAALGARILARFKDGEGRERSIYRTVGNTSSHGGNGLVQHLGLGDAGRVHSLTIDWPTSKTTQTIRDIPADRSIEVTEFAEGYRVLEGPKPGRGAGKTH